ncbi:Nuclear envelope morphology protein 1 [Escovopsis weberi]|uniref:Nuclear envelope morphology protein 1 n=1 Tax=Escovopsis weberi TaxID=150374 RepID=A0A0M8N4N7_ESCWE|nr:Nuclear envelope morphology protein 1 [Escovopsis weberi]
MPHGPFSLFGMNSLNIITARVSPPPSPTHSRSNSIGSIGVGVQPEGEKLVDLLKDGSDSPKTRLYHEGRYTEKRYRDDGDGDDDDDDDDYDDENSGDGAFIAEETPLFCESKIEGKRSAWWHLVPRSIASTIITSIRWIFATLASPGVFLATCLYDEFGNFAPMTQLAKLLGFRKQKMEADHVPARASAEGTSGTPSRSAGRSSRYLSVPTPRYASSSGTSSSGLTSESEGDESNSSNGRSSPRFRSAQRADEDKGSRRSIRIKLNNDDAALQQRKHKKSQSGSNKAGGLSGDDISAQLKSPTSPIAALTKYPKTPAPPRPLIPRRQPSYLNLGEMSRKHKHKKTLILDLDETLIHSMSKGGRLNSGHMVEVQLNTATLGMSGQSNAAHHPILYWVNKRPYCDEFLRRVCKWFNLVVFTASVQEYADPVIDWLESERKFFSARYYRQHCTYRQGAYIKDLSSVEPDLSKVMILDNSPLSYLFHEGGRGRDEMELKLS